MLFLVTGGAGFVGSNVSERLLMEGHEVRIMDNLSRPGGMVEDNIRYLENKFREKLNSGDLEIIKKSVANFADVKECMNGVDAIIHLAAQTAMTTSITNPAEDFTTNAIGSFSVIEAARQVADEATILYTSTNKVYGDLKAAGVVEKDTRYDFLDEKYTDGIKEDFPIDPESPYGCSKYSGESYFSDYYSTYGMKTVVFRCSSMYGERQKALEDQGWVSWFISRILKNEPLTIFGNGKQTRDILHVEDVVECVVSAIKKIEVTKGNVFNIGGGRANAISILELINFVEKETGKKAKYKFDKWRFADQPAYFSDINKARDTFGWYPKISKHEGIRRQIKWESSG